MAAGRRACATAATGPATSPGTARTAPTAGPGAAAAEAPSATGWNRIELLLAVCGLHRFLICHCNFEGVTVLVTLPASAPRLTEEIASVEAAEVTAEEAASATSATGSGTSPGSAARRRTGATSATVGRLSVELDVDCVTNPLIVYRNWTHCPQLQPGGGHLLQLQSGEAGVWLLKLKCSMSYCFRCKIGHIVKDCPNAGTKTCYKCGGVGHILRECPSK